MKFYTNQKYNRIIYMLVPIVLLVLLIEFIFKLNYFTNIIVSNIIFLILSSGLIYATYKQSKIPIFEIKNDTLFINDVILGKKKLTIDSISGFKKHLIFGHKLLTLGGDLAIPFKSLSKKDRELFLGHLKLRI